MAETKTNLIGGLYTYNRVVHGSPFRLLFDSFSFYFSLTFSRMRCENEFKMRSKRRLFTKWATPPHFVQGLLFDFIFDLIFERTI